MKEIIAVLLVLEDLLKEITPQKYREAVETNWGGNYRKVYKTIGLSFIGAGVFASIIGGPAFGLDVFITFASVTSWFIIWWAVLWFYQKADAKMRSMDVVRRNQ